jgi:hypothetical protein
MMDENHLPETVTLYRKMINRKNWGWYFKFGIGTGINYFCDDPLIYWPDGKTEYLSTLNPNDVFRSEQIVVDLPVPYPGAEPDFTSGKVFYLNPKKSNAKGFPHLKVDLYIPAAALRLEEVPERTQNGFQISDKVYLISQANPVLKKFLRKQEYEDQELKAEAMECLGRLVESEAKVKMAIARLQELDPDHTLMDDHNHAVKRVSGKENKSVYPSLAYIYK